MKKSIICLMFLALFMSCHEEQGPKYVIKGTVDGTNQGKVYLNKQVGYNFKKIDSTIIENGTFEFEGKVDIPDIYGLSFEGKNGMKRFCLENTNYQVAVGDTISKSQIIGGSCNDVMISFGEKMRAIELEERQISKRARALWKDENASDEDRQKAADDLNDFRNDVKVAYAKKFITENKNSPFTPSVLNIYVRNYLDLNQLDSIYQTFTDDVKQSNSGIQLGTSITNTKLTAVGNPFLDFSAYDPEGKTIKLSDVVKANELVFVDFWASWCGPCRMVIPQLKEIYGEYHPRGLEMFAVSYDSSKEKWEKAMDEEDFNWINASNLKGWGCPSASLYAVRGIPANVLITNDGTIVGKNLFGDKLKETIEAHLKTES